jgi:hypothetical protein
MIMNALRGSRLGKQREIFNISAACLYEMGMSDVFAVLLVAPICFENAICLDSCENDPGTNLENSTCEIQSSTTRTRKRRVAPKRIVIPLPGRTRPTGQTPFRSSPHSAVSCLELLELLRLFQRLVAETHFWPDYRLDGPEK